MQRCETTGGAGEHPGKAGLPGEACLDSGNDHGFREYRLYPLQVLKLCFNRGFKEGAEAAGLELVSPWLV